MSMDGHFNNKFTVFLIKKNGGIQESTFYRTHLDSVDSWIQYHRCSGDYDDYAMHGMIYIDFPRHCMDNEPNRLIMELWNGEEYIYQMCASSVNNYTLTT